MTLTEFLLARIAEDEARALHDDLNDLCDDPGGDGGPSRVLAECAAKRRIVEEYEGHRGSVMAYRSPRWRDAMNEQDRREWSKAEARHRVAEDMARALASVYAGHPDYRPEWSA